MTIKVNVDVKGQPNSNGLKALLSELWKSLLFSEMRLLLGQAISDYGSDAIQTFLNDCYESTQFLDKKGYMRALMTRTRILR